MKCLRGSESSLFLRCKVRENHTKIQKVRVSRHIAQKRSLIFSTFRCLKLCTNSLNRVILKVRETEIFSKKVHQTKTRKDVAYVLFLL